MQGTQTLTFQDYRYHAERRLAQLAEARGDRFILPPEPYEPESS
jgi:hypothetical protein